MVSKPFDEVYFAMCKGIDTPKSLALWIAFRERSQDLFRLAPRPADYLTAHAFSLDYAAYSYVSKYVGADFGINKREVALQSFTTTEGQCLYANRRIESMTQLDSNPVVARAISFARQKIAEVLGAFEKRYVLAQCRWGNGATATLSKRRAHVDKKHCGTSPSVSPGAVYAALELIHSDSSWYELLTGGCGPVYLDVIDYNRVETVPKSAKTDRLIAAEPTYNGLLQQGTGRYIRARLKSHGVNLSDQSINQTWASLSTSLGCCTLDLSSASDTISRELVYQLLPIDWYLWLDSIRSQYSRLPDGRFCKLHKFSSMGNAFTFELETLIFWALTLGASRCSNRWCVTSYGDDIICHQSDADRVIEVLQACGFTVNTEKSYTRGLFYESCGKHYFNGFDVTPAYQKAELNDAKSLANLSELIRAHNRLVRLSFRLGHGILEPSLTPALRAIRRIALGLAGRVGVDEMSLTMPVDDGMDECLLDPFEESPTGGLRRVLWRVRIRSKEERAVQLSAYNLWWRMEGARLFEGTNPTLSDTGYAVHRMTVSGVLRGGGQMAVTVARRTLLSQPRDGLVRALASSRETEPRMTSVRSAEDGYTLYKGSTT